MSDKRPVRNIPPALQPAFELFIKELDAHVIFLQRTVQQIAELQSQNGSSNAYLKELTSLSHRFHTIKGGAGFFQLSEIKDFAGTLEKLFQSQGAFSSEDAIKEELQNAILAFSTELAQIRSSKEQV